ncbi:MAG: IS3 family transposase [Massiliimalia sp.]|jgi:repressor of nif and glnA expression
MYNYIFRNKRNHTCYTKRREELRTRTPQIYDESKQILEARKSASVMKEEGYKVGQETVRKLMRDIGLLSIQQDAKKVYTKEHCNRTTAISYG